MHLNAYLSAKYKSIHKIFMVTKSNSLHEEYSNCKNLYDELSDKLKILMNELMLDAQLQHHSISSRSKSIESLKGKLSKPDKNYKTLEDITDLCGLRIITYFSEDVDKVAQIIEKEFTIDKENSIDKRINNDSDRFGYLSLHYIATFNSDRDALTEYKKFKNIKFEIQIRSILQHAWAEIEHDIGYKSQSALPKDFRRRFARISGLLEIADSEFDGLRSQLNEYKEKITQQIQSKSKDIELNSITLKSFISSNPLIIEIDKKIASELNVPLRETTIAYYESRTTLYKQLGITNLTEAELILTTHKEKIVNFAIKFFKFEEDAKIQSGITNGSSLLYAVYINLALSKNQEQIKEILSNVVKDQKIIDLICRKIINAV